MPGVGDKDVAGGPAPAIECRGLGKRFYLRDNDANPVKRLLRRMQPGNREVREHWALRDINLTVQPNESIALIGVNGSGKSTLLKLISSTTRATDGSLKVRGRVGGILDIAAGFHHDLTGYENVFLQCALLGITRSQVWERLGAIEEFCELGHFLNAPVRHYSSGMFLRLAFSIAVHTDPDIFIIDEALAVGDGYFMWKCMEKIKAMQREGKTFLYVSHTPEQVESLCSRAVWLHEGRVRADGPITDVLQQYHEFQFANLLAGPPSPHQHELSALIPYSRFGNGQVTLQDVRLLDEQNMPARYFPQGTRATISVTAEATVPVERASLYCILERPGQSVTFIDSMERGRVFRLVAGSNRLQIELPNLALQPGPYYLTLAIGDADNIDTIYDAHQKIYSFTVVPGSGRSDRYFSQGTVRMNTRICVERN